jgi:hypothetical protein
MHEIFKKMYSNDFMYIVIIRHSHLGSLVEQMVASHRKEVEQGGGAFSKTILSY